MSELPQSWVLAPISTLAERVVVGHVGPTSEHYVPDGIVMLRGQDIQAGKLDLSRVVRVSDEFHRSHPKSSVEPGDVVVVRIGRSGEAAVVPEAVPVANTAGLVVIKRPNGVLARYLAAYLNSPVGQAASRDEVRGVTRSTLNTGSVAKATVPVPPLAEQRRIVAKLDQVMARTACARVELARIPALIAHHKRAILAAAFDGSLTKEWRASNNAPEWLEECLENVCTSIADGDHQAPPRAQSGVPFITISAMNDGEIKLEQASRFVPLEYYEALDARRRPQRGDVLFSVTGSIGISAVVSGEDRFVFQRHIAILRPNSERISQAFLMFLLRDEKIQDQARDVATGTAQLTIPLGGLRRFGIMLPSLQEQTEIVRRIESAFAWLDKVAHEHAQATRLLDHLDQALLAKAFRGELVPQDPADEPAAALLARIRAEREAAAPVARKRKVRG